MPKEERPFVIDEQGTLPQKITLRRESENDVAFLRDLYATTRDYEMALLDWSPVQKRQFLEQQFEAQYRYYKESFSDARFDIILYAETPIGRLYLQQREEEFRLIDIALSPDFRGQGLGDALMRQLQQDAAVAGLPIRIHVERMNPALRLYQRLGFQILEEKEIHLFMEWRPAQVNTAS